MKKMILALAAVTTLSIYAGEANAAGNNPCAGKTGAARAACREEAGLGGGGRMTADERAERRKARQEANGREGRNRKGDRTKMAIKQAKDKKVKVKKDKATKVKKEKKKKAKVKRAKSTHAASYNTAGIRADVYNPYQ